MLTSVYLKTLRDLQGQVLVWGLGLALLGAVNVLFFPSFKQVPGLLNFLENLPPVLKSFLGDIRDLVSLEGFLRVKLFDPLPLLLAVFGVTQGAQAIAGEIEHKTVDFLLAQPIRRRRVVLEKYLAIVTATVIIAFMLALGLIISVLFTVEKLDLVGLVQATVNALPLTWLFTALALLGSCAAAKIRHATILAGTVVVASYTFETLRLTSPALARWESVSLFAYHKHSFSLSGGFSFAPISVLLALTAVLVMVGVVVFQRRDVAV